MSTPYDKDFELTAVSGEPNYFELRLPYRGTLRQLVLKQVTGVLAGFAADLFKSRRVLPEIASSSASSAGNPPVDEAMFKVIPSQAADAAEDTVELMDVEYPYHNRDGSTASPARRLYLRIEPEGSGDKVFQLAVSIQTPEF